MLLKMPTWIEITVIKMTDNEIIAAFHAMWDNFPEGVVITQKSREIVAVNKAAAKYGLTVGIKCSSLGKPEDHKGCRCNQAVDSGETQCYAYDGPFGKAYGFWVPITEKPEWILHFSVGRAFEYEKFTAKGGKKMESIHGLTKGTDLEQAVEALALGEAKGVMMYYALARLAKEQGLDEVAETFIASANQEAVHAGFYAVMNGKYPKDFWKLVAGAQKAETAGETTIKALADKVRAAGFTAAADEMEIFAKQEGHHGVVLGEILEKYAPKVESVEGKKVYVCSVCGYEYEGDEVPDDFVCPICGQPKSVFKLKE